MMIMTRSTTSILLTSLITIKSWRDMLYCAISYYSTGLIILFTHTYGPALTLCCFVGTVYDFDKARAKSLEQDSRISLTHDHDAGLLRNECKTGRLSRRSSSAETLSSVLDQSLDSFLSATENPYKSPTGTYHRRSSSTATYEDIKVNSSSSFEATSVPSSPLLTPEPLVDVRIIDFAHSTHKGLGDPVVYSGPDRGFLFGLENMIALLKGIERDHGWDKLIVLKYKWKIFMWFDPSPLLHKWKGHSIVNFIHKLLLLINIRLLSCNIVVCNIGTKKTTHKKKRFRNSLQGHTALSHKVWACTVCGSLKYQLQFHWMLWSCKEYIITCCTVCRLLLCKQ